MNELLPNNKTICIILSGGLSTRMKTHKALLRFSSNENFLQHITNVYRNAGINRVIVVKNYGIVFKTDELVNRDVIIVENYFPERGRLYSLQLGLSTSPDAQYCFIQNIDNPFITEDLINSLYNVRDFADYISPEFNNKGGHPILITRRVIKKISLLTGYRNTLNEILLMFSRYKIITDDPNCLLNINYPSDYEKYFSNTSEINPGS